MELRLNTYGLKARTEYIKRKKIRCFPQKNVGSTIIINIYFGFYCWSI